MEAAMARKDDSSKLYDGIKKVRVAMMTLPDKDGELHSRPMYSQNVDPDGSLWFFTSASSEKVPEIEVNGKVNLAYADPGSNFFATVNGRAEIVEDRDEVRKRWSEGARAWFPKGKDDPDLALIKVTPERGEYWDGPSSTILHLYGYIKARLTGAPPTEMTEDRKVRL
jgi:general stress protein 26